MSKFWVDTDFGFDDLWALLVLRHYGCEVAGVSLVAGNTPLPRVVANALGAKEAYDLNWPLWQGAVAPLKRDPETAERILGPDGMRSRGAKLPKSKAGVPDTGALDEIRGWLGGSSGTERQILALGPLTNLAALLMQFPEAARMISRLVWMGGSSGRGNHTATAEFNAVADAEAVECVLNSGVPIDIVDLEFCRRVAFSEADMPDTDPLTRDLLGGYLDIALERGRPGMAIYDPLAALALAVPDAIGFTPCVVEISTEPDDSYGATRIQAAARSSLRLATEARADLGRMCLNALEMETANGHRQ